jgi:hypothetical protein
MKNEPFPRYPYRDICIQGSAPSEDRGNISIRPIPRPKMRRAYQFFALTIFKARTSGSVSARIFLSSAFSFPSPFRGFSSSNREFSKRLACHSAPFEVLPGKSLYAKVNANFRSRHKGWIHWKATTDKGNNWRCLMASVFEAKKLRESRRQAGESPDFPFFCSVPLLVLKIVP